MGPRASGVFEIGSTEHAHSAGGTPSGSGPGTEAINQEVKPVSNLHRKHPVSIAVSMALLAAMATSAMASPATGAPADNQGAQTPAPQDGPTASPAARKANSKAATAGQGNGNGETVELSTVTVVGVRASQMRAIDLKRMAPDIQDSISAESIGQLPDTTITDALQRITGVQIDRNAGEGTQVDVRGLPEVGSMMNGEVFITPDQITSQQPNFETLPATLFNQVDVIKSPTASQTETGISGSLNLHTFRPWDLPHGFTFSYNADAERGDTSRKTGPEATGLVSFNDNGRWGLLLSADYSDTTRNGPENEGANAGSSEGLDQYGVILDREDAVGAGAYNGFVGAWNRKLPRQGHSLKLDSRAVCGLGRKVRGGTRPRLSWGRSSLYSLSQVSVTSRTCSMVSKT